MLFKAIVRLFSLLTDHQVDSGSNFGPCDGKPSSLATWHPGLRHLCVHIICRPVAYAPGEVRESTPLPPIYNWKRNKNLLLRKDPPFFIQRLPKLLSCFSGVLLNTAKKDKGPKTPQGTTRELKTPQGTTRKFNCTTQ